MKRQVYILILIILATGCRKDCARRVENMQMFPVVNSSTTEPSQIKGWYYSEFQNDKVNFTLEFDHYGAGELCDYYWENYPNQNSIKIYCNKDLYNNNDTLKAGQVLNKLFEIQKHEPGDFFISFLISEKESSEIHYPDKFYTFSASINTSKNEFFNDSCIIRKF